METERWAGTDQKFNLADEDSSHFIRGNSSASISLRVTQIKALFSHQDLPHCVLQGLSESHGNPETSASPVVDCCTLSTPI